VGKGQEIPAEKVKRLDLVLVDGKVMQRSEALEELAALGQEMEALLEKSPAEPEMAPEPEPEPEAPSQIVPPHARRRRRKY
jgi:hypothetical protein